MEHTRLQIERLLGCRHITRVEINGIGAYSGKRLPECRRVWLGPPQRLARGNLHEQEWQADRGDLWRMTIGPDVGGRQRKDGRRLLGIDNSAFLQRLRRCELRADHP